MIRIRFFGPRGINSERVLGRTVLVEYYAISAKDQSRIHQFGKKVLPGLFLGYALYAGTNLEGWHNGCRHWGAGNDGRIGNLLEKELNAKDVIFPEDNGKFIFPVADGRITLSGRDQELRTIHFDTGQPNSRTRSKRFLKRIRRGLFHHLKTHFPRPGEATKWFLVHFRKLHIPPSRWTRESNLTRPKRRIIPGSTEIHWRLQNCAYKLGCYARKPRRWLLEYRWIKRFVWFLDRFHSVYFVTWETSRRIYMDRVETDKNGNWHPGQIIYGQNSG